MPTTHPPRSAAARLTHVPADEPLALVLATPAGPDELEGVLPELRSLSGPRTVVAAVPGPDAWQVGLSVIAGQADRLVLTGPWAGHAAPQLGAEAEPDAFRAVVGAMQSLAAGQAFVLLWPAAWGRDAGLALIEQGLRWRAAWEAPEDGEFYHLPAA